MKIKRFSDEPFCKKVHPSLSKTLMREHKSFLGEGKSPVSFCDHLGDRRRMREENPFVTKRVLPINNKIKNLTVEFGLNINPNPAIRIFE